MAGRRRPLLLLAAVAVAVAACASDEPGRGPTAAPSGNGPVAPPVPGLDGEHARMFAVGDRLFNDTWVTAPAATEARDGLGPLFNATSCSACHVAGGRGEPPSGPDDPARGLLLRLSERDADGSVGPTAAWGDQLQDRSIRGVPAEGTVVITSVERPGTYPDGTPYTLVEPEYTIIDRDGRPFPSSILISPRLAPAVFGVGLLEAVPTAAVLAAADPHDEDGDGISGRPHLVTGVDGEEVLGRFGWKAAVPSLAAQTAGAFNGDLGITSPRHRGQPCTRLQAECLAAPTGGEPELDQGRLDQVTFYTRTLAVPPRRDGGSATTTAGQAAFERIGCSRCHRPELRTGASDVPALAHRVIRPYTDLLLHDMGEGLADHRPDGAATGREWRTPPLWGIGLVATDGPARFLHDGRARSLEEAVLWHGGEAEGARVRFTELSAPVRRQLLAFLASL